MASKLYIKRLELSGFKSFVKGATFTFDTGLTAIVGPNGCGKSNIIDAVRWVLGEQSARALRGAKMEELIFHGSEREKPVGMAEVILTLDNAEGLLSKQGPEVSITRRLYRSGESEYLINKSAVRLKDVTDIILDTGMTTGAYMIMEQGKIDSVLIARPTERLALFEEAAGVMRYQLQKEEALRKLEATQHNLVRVGDIVHELKRQLDSLERQARHAEQFQEMRKRAQGLRARQRAVELSRGQAELVAAEEAASRARSEMETSREAVNTRQAALREVRERQAQVERAARELERALATLRESQLSFRSQIEDLKLQLLQLSVQQKERESRQAEASATQERLAGKAVRAQQEEAQDESELSRTTAEVAQLEEQVRSLERSLEESRDALTARRKELGSQADRLYRTEEAPQGDAEAPPGPLAEFREHVPSVVWPLGKLFKAEEKYHAAVQAALGPLADAAVVETWEQAHALLTAWREQREAPLTLVVLEAVGEPEPRGSLPEGARGWADELVAVAPKHAVLARALLGSVAVMEGEAGPGSPRGPLAFTSGVKLTPPGIVWWPGRLAGGRTATGTELAMLLSAAVRELGEIEAKIVENEAALTEARRRESMARVEGARIEQRLHGRRGERETLEQTVQEAASLAQRLRSELEGIHGDHQRIQEELKRREAQWTEEQKRQDAQAGQLVAAQDQLQQVRDQIAAAEQELDEARGKMETCQLELVAMEARYHEAKSRYELVKHEFTGEFGTEMGRFEELAAQPLTDEEAAQLARLDARLADMEQGVNLLALEEFQSMNERYTEYQKQIEDLRKSRESLQRAIYRLDRESEKRFDKTFATVRENFHAMFRRLFGGGEADLHLTESEEGERGIEIEVRPPGKRAQSIALLSGGERALVSTSLLFSLYMTKPSPFCFLDELDAPLDDANTDRFMKILKEFSAQTQFVMISHNKHTVEMVDSLYGITMEDPGVSKIVSVRLKTLQPAQAA